ncbi:uncharacterized protein LOC120344517 [Styela clava]|uniref:uncharacterized protein LOC120344517 n=1 Tax=Styela clava TaxID=7725 RepID=UPI0019399ADB|nr:uncharacterized protein LOC120344517 [Styela clava]
MDVVEILFFLSLICGLLAEVKLPAGICRSQIVKGKLVQVGDCEIDDGSDILKLIQKSLDEKKKAEIKCDVTYKTKCFRIVVYDTRNVTFNDAQPICKSMNNGKLANIYDLAHYQSLRTYLRSLIPASSTYKAIWTGMQYKNNQLLLSSGEPTSIATEVWYPGYPKSDASWTNVGVDVNKDPEFSRQGMFNEQPSYSLHGIICEI